MGTLSSFGFPLKPEKGLEPQNDPIEDLPGPNPCFFGCSTNGMLDVVEKSSWRKPAVRRGSNPENQPGTPDQAKAPLGRGHRPQKARRQRNGHEPNAGLRL